MPKTTANLLTKLLHKPSPQPPFSPPSIPPLPHPRQAKPTADHAGKKRNTNRMQHPRPRPLRHQPRHKRRHRAPTTPRRADKAQPTHLQPAAQQATKNDRRARIHRPQHQAQDRDRDPLPHHIRHEPDEQLEGDGEQREAHHARFLADQVRGVGEQESAERDAGPEAGGYVAGGERGGVSVGEQEGDDPAGDGDFGALVGEDEEGAEEGRFVAESCFEGGAFGGGGRCGGGLGGLRAGGGVVCGAEERGLGLGEVGLVGSEGPGCEEEVEEGDGEGEEVVSRPAVVVGDECGGDQRADRPAQAVAAVEGAERAGGVG